MTVQELINELKSLPQDHEVHFAYNYGDHWRTQVAPKVQNAELMLVTHSAYHDMDRVSEEDTPDGRTLNREVVVIS